VWYNAGMDYQTLQARPLIDNRFQITREEWKATHRDFRGGSTRTDSATILTLIPGSGTCLVPVVVVKTLLDAFDAQTAGLLAQTRRALEFEEAARASQARRSQAEKS